jgi:photosystem II stability/assembly factor-like uncharacterized protein
MKQPLPLLFVFFSFFAHCQPSPWKWINPSPQGNPLQSVTTVPGTLHAIAVGGYGTIMRSTDAGRHWQVIESPTRAPLQAVTFINQTTGVAVGRGVLLKTTDGGQSWTMGNAPALDLEAIVFTDPNTAFAAGRAIAESVQLVGYIYKTTDGGSTWTKVYEGSSYGFKRLTASGRDVVYVTQQFSGVILTTSDAGSTWRPLPFTTSHDDLDIQFIDGSSGVLTAQGFGASQVFVTGDRGATWQPAATGLAGRLGLLPGSVLYLTSGSQVHLSTDKGRTWRQKFTGKARITRTALPDSLHAVAISADGELYHADAATAQWQPFHTNLSTTYGDRFSYSAAVQTVHFSSASTGYAAVHYGNDIMALMKTTNGGCRWENVTSFYDPVQCIYFLNDQTGFVAHGSPNLVPGRLSKTTDAGKPGWSAQSHGSRGAFTRCTSPARPTGLPSPTTGQYSSPPTGASTGPPTGPRGSAAARSTTCNSSTIPRASSPTGSTPSTAPPTGGEAGSACITTVRCC